MARDGYDELELRPEAVEEDAQELDHPLQVHGLQLADAHLRGLLDENRHDLVREVLRRLPGELEQSICAQGKRLLERVAKGSQTGK